MSAPQQEITGLRTGLGLGLGGGIGLLLASLLTSTSRWDWWPVFGVGLLVGALADLQGPRTP